MDQLIDQIADKSIVEKRVKLHGKKIVYRNHSMKIISVNFCDFYYFNANIDNSLKME